tara:strand:- start:3 stop:689 length:687 start_codon:yes stop_codon:yes gene_type:complete
MRILFVRHAETDWNKANRFQGIVDIDISEHGKYQANLLSEYLYKQIPSINKIYTSPLKRTKHTASYVAKKFNLNIHELDSLIEYSVGVFAGMNIDDIYSGQYQETYEDFMEENNWNLVPDAETFDSRYQRAIKALQIIFNESDENSCVLVVSHGGFMQTLISVLLGSKRVWGFKTNNTGIYEFSIEENNVQLNDDGEWVSKQDDYIVLNPKKWGIIRFNDVTHLKERE